MPHCSNCHAEIADDAQACPECGAIFEEEHRTESAESSLLPLYSVAIGVSVVSAACLLLLLFRPTSLFGVEYPRWQKPLFLLLWCVAAGGIWTQSRRGYTLGAVVFGLVTILSGLVALRMTGIVPRQMIRWMPMDPVSLLLSGIRSLQVMVRSRTPLPFGLFRLGAYLGTILSGGIGILLWQRRWAVADQTLESSDGESEKRAGGARSLTQGPLVALLGSVGFVIASPLLNLGGLDTPSLAIKSVVAAFPSLMAALMGYLQLTRSGGLDSSVSVGVIVATGIVIPVALALDMRQVRQHTDWQPNRPLYFIGSVLLWFVTVPLYLYRRMQADAG